MDEVEPIRVCNIVSANCSISLKSLFPEETIDFLVGKALGVIAAIDDDVTMNTIKKGIREEMIKMYKESKETK